MLKPDPIPPRRPWVVPAAIALIIAVIAGVAWLRDSGDDTAGDVAAQTESNWLTRLWGSGTNLVTGAKAPPGQPERKGPIAPGLKLAAAFPYPDDPSQARAAIAYGDNQPQLFKPDDVVAGEYTLQDVEIGYVTLDKKGRTFYLYREYTAEELARRAEREKKREQRMAEKKRERERLGPPKAAEPVTMEDGRIYIPVVGGPDLIKDPKTGEVTTVDGQPAEEPEPPPEEPTEADKEFEQWWKENVPEDMREEAPQE